jgi:MHS family proline/betaine transporter-like MFS transporter
MILQSFLIIIAIITLIISGKIADKKSPTKVMQFGALMLILFSYPLLWIVDQGLFPYIIGAQMLLIIFNEILLGPSNAFLKNLFPMSFRYRGVSLSFTLGLSLIGGLTPVIENYLYQATGRFSSIAVWPIVIGIGTYISIKFATRQQSNGTQGLLKPIT